jgi:hypothetical protein
MKPGEAMLNHIPSLEEKSGFLIVSSIHLKLPSSSTSEITENLRLP